MHNALVWGISLDEPAANKAFREKYGFPFPLLSDLSRQVTLAYGAVENVAAEKAGRITVLVDTQGRIRQVLTDITPETHAQDVLAAIG